MPSLTSPDLPSLRLGRLPRDLHPVAWWAWALGLAAAAARTTNPWLLLLIVAVVSATVVARRTDAPWAMSFRLYLVLGAVVVLVRVVFRVLLGGGFGETVLLDLPAVPLPSWAAGITLLGPLTQEALLGAVYDGLRLATIIICVGGANSLADPRKLLASLPAALYEMGTAVVIAFSLFPQLAESVQRVRRARRLRGDPGSGIGSLRRIVVPVLEDALERSVALAASMDSRGYGRRGTASVRRRRATGTCLVLGLTGLCIGAYGYLDTTAPRALAWPMLLTGAALAAAGFAAAGHGVVRSHYRPTRWTPAAVATAASGFGAATLMTLAARELPVVLPGPATLPLVSWTALAAVAVGALPAVVTPPPVSHTTDRRTPSRSTSAPAVPAIGGERRAGVA